MYNVIVVSPDHRAMVYKFESLHHAQSCIIDMVVGRADALGNSISKSELQNALLLNSGINYANWQWHINEAEG